MDGTSLTYSLLIVIAWLFAAGLYCEVIVHLWMRERFRAALNLIYLPLAAALAWGMLWNTTRYSGHVTCDFAGQWLMGRMFVRGEGHLLYTIDKDDKRCGAQWQAFADGYRGEAPNEPLGEMYNDIVAKNTWGGDLFEGPLYPPTAGLLFYPVAIIGSAGYPDPHAPPDPEMAHKRLGQAYVAFGFLSAWLMSWGSRGRIRFGEAALLIFCFPNFTHSLLLGQNPPLTLLILTGGWALWARGFPIWGGIVWGLLAYKPVFAVAVVWVPILLLSWRMLAGMAASGAVFCLLTLPFCLPPEQRVLLHWDPETTWFKPTSLDHALEPWRRWYVVGKNAKHIYDHETNWTFMSRDVYSLPRRDVWYGDNFDEHFAFTFYYDRKKQRFSTDFPLPEDMWKNKIISERVELFPNGQIGLRPAPPEKSKPVEANQSDSVDPDDATGAESESLPDSAPASKPGSLRVMNVNHLGYALMGGVFFFTLFVALTEFLRRAVAGVPLGYDVVGSRIGFLFLGALLTTFHFIHYDLLSFAVPVAMILGGRHTVVGWIWLAIWCVIFGLMSFDLAVMHQSMRMPVETLWIIVLWLYAGFAGLFEPLRKPAAEVEEFEVWTAAEEPERPVIAK